eukprot:TRINITY_DN2359_c2_g2_i1.p1 TRINITY_DN2359_c2_g2~~TRINITY_DN2359_c2_g2_i1.p1  ORF type:complete len:106 (-),score=18.57 TRINITY_DN2359_c2_g2_i1:304-621(-)
MPQDSFYEYLTEQEVPQPIVQKLRNRQMNGELFSLYNTRKFVDTFKINEAGAQKLVFFANLSTSPTKARVDSSSSCFFHIKSKCQVPGFSANNWSPDTSQSRLLR